MPGEVVVVTGVSGFVASHVVKLLLEEGYRVRGTVRSLDNSSKTEPLKNLVKEPKHPLELVEADLTKDEGWDKALEGSKFLIHTASPFPNMLEKDVPEEELVVPAKEGTLRVLKAAAAAKIKRVVLTSSFVAVSGSPDAEHNKEFAEEDWTNPDDPTIDAYTKSKVIAERAAWDYVKELPEEETFELAVINPCLVFGPVLMESNKEATSTEIMAQILTSVHPGHPKITLLICDVRDVARAHVKALIVPEAAGYRHLISSCTLWLKDIAAVVAREFQPQGYSVSTMQLPYVICWLYSLFNKQLRTIILPRYGKMLTCSNKRMVEVLGIEPTPHEKTIIDMVYSLVDLGIVKKTKNFREPEARN